MTHEPNHIQNEKNLIMLLVQEVIIKIVVPILTRAMMPFFLAILDTTILDCIIQDSQYVRCHTLES